jgi:hypothetical protein
MGIKESIDKVNQVIEESKKLTTKDRKKLKSSTFCGPNRSFPVPDCKHVATAKAYLNRSNFSKATKQKIAACINRKAKQLGCKTTTPAKTKGTVKWEDLSFIELALADTEIFKTTRELVDQSLEAEEEMELDFNDCEGEDCK